ncbi:MAG TPA: cytochrome c oxidase assembly protein [Thermoanaerobaculia bacterium]|nr:cytochrome c oxidase assembly protein [Thermoanaerobaculia bacterium]
MRRIALCLAIAPCVYAHNGEIHAAQVWNALTAVSLLFIATLYLAGLRQLWTSDAGHQTIPRWRAASFFLGWIATGVSLLGPLDRWSDVLFSAHMAQHEILMLLAAPLMVLGRPFIAMLWALSARNTVAAIVRHRAWDYVTGPFFVLVLHAAVLWMWHVPFLFEAALQQEWVHVLQHLGFFVTAALFWWALIHGRYGKLGYGIGVLYVFATAMHTQILGALLTFGSRSWYPTHAARTAAAGVNPIDDQQFAGILMWIPFGVVFLFVGLALFAAWLGEAERRVAFTSAERAKRAMLLMLLVVLGGCRGQDDRTARQLTGGDPDRGKDAIRSYGCGACHTVPGVKAARGLVGPPLHNIGSRMYLAGQLPNTPDNMKRWIREPQSIEKDTAMPNMNVTAEDARDIAAYLYTLR